MLESKCFDKLLLWTASSSSLDFLCSEFQSISLSVKLELHNSLPYNQIINTFVFIHVFHLNLSVLFSSEKASFLRLPFLRLLSNPSVSLKIEIRFMPCYRHRGSCLWESWRFPMKDGSLVLVFPSNYGYVNVPPVNTDVIEILVKTGVKLINE